jgi:8-oxo-dGTP diphosphatase
VETRRTQDLQKSNQAKTKANINQKTKTRSKMMGRRLLCCLRVAACLIVSSALQSAAWISRHNTRFHTPISLFTSTTNSDLIYPRAAVSTAVRCTVKEGAGPHYLLVQRGNPPNANLWSLPGGKLDLGEMALAGGKRELAEETKFDDLPNLRWYNGTFSTTDAFKRNEDGTVAFHYLIAHCFAEIEIPVNSLPQVSSADDAADARWWSIDEIKQRPEETTPGLHVVLDRAEALYQKELL